MQKEFTQIVKRALEEDCALNDITSDAIIPKDAIGSFEIKAREDIIFCGKSVITEVFSELKKSKKFEDAKINLKIFAKDGSAVKAGKSIARIDGNVKLILAAERVILNLIQHLSGVATLTNKFVSALNNKKIKILDTRKTIPTLRALEKYAVKIGGGKNHRMNLSDMILIKDNHIAACASVKKAITKAQEFTKKLKQNLQIEVECDNYKQVLEAIDCKPDIIMLDNMKISEIEKCIKSIRTKSKKILIEISGGVNLENIKNLSNLDVDFISIGAITQAAKAVDIGLDAV